MTTPAQATSCAEMPQHLVAALRARLPRASLHNTALPLCPSIRLWLLGSDYPQWELDGTTAAALMDAPPYWSFCWASGQVLARYLLDNPVQVRGKRVLDFGAGSGVVAIAAKHAGAEQCWALDSDPLALESCAANAALNGVEITLLNSLDLVPPADVVLLADVFYDATNLPLLPTLKQRFAAQIVADSRRKAEDFVGLHPVTKRMSHTVPDLDESGEFNHVTIYQSAR